MIVIVAPPTPFHLKLCVLSFWPGLPYCPLSNSFRLVLFMGPRKPISSVSKRHKRLIVKNRTEETLQRFLPLQQRIITRTERPFDISQDIVEEESPESNSFFNFENLCSQVTVTEKVKCDFVFELREWALEHNVSHQALTSLLKILGKRGFDNLPTDSRSLLKTKRKFQVLDVEPGRYVHLGLQRGLKNYFSAKGICPETVYAIINIDGIPISKSSRSEFWPILCSVNDDLKSPFCVGIYHGQGKPKDHNLFLRPFVDECKSLLKDGLKTASGSVNFHLKGFVCDAPARAFITCTKGHTGFSACSKCTQTGEWHHDRVVFSEKVGEPRTDDRFGTDEEHHRGHTILTELGVGLVTSIPFEFMHLVCLGVVRKLFNLWVSGKPKHTKLSGQQVENLSKRLLWMRPFVPSDFNRKPRHLNELARWKATEFRQFILYTGPIVMRDFLQIDVYKHFMCLHTAIFILCDTQLVNCYKDYAEELLSYFVKSFSTLYGKEHLSYNVHGLLHICADTVKFGNLDRYSAFGFENCLGVITRLLKSGNSPLSQACRRISEREKGRLLVTREEGAKLVHTNGPLPLGFSSPQFTKYSFKNFDLSTNKRDQYFSTSSGDVVRLQNIVTRNSDNKVFLYGQKLVKKEPLYTIPCDSSKFGIFRCKVTTKNCIVDPVLVSKKYFVTQISPSGSELAALPLLDL